MQPLSHCKLDAAASEAFITCTPLVYSGTYNSDHVVRASDSTAVFNVFNIEELRKTPNKLLIDGPMPPEVRIKAFAKRANFLDVHVGAFCMSEIQALVAGKGARVMPTWQQFGSLKKGRVQWVL
jgi:hypothetical protein